MIPAILAHALINVPIRSELYIYTAPALGVAAFATPLFFAGARNFATGLFKAASGSWLGFSLAGALLAILFARQGELVGLAAIPVWLCLCMFYALRLFIRPKAD